MIIMISMMTQFLDFGQKEMRMTKMKGGVSVGIIEVLKNEVKKWRGK